MSTYHTTVQDVYRKAAEEPDAKLCCVPQTPMFLPGLVIPDIMHQMNYGCGTTVFLQDMKADQTVIYVGVGGGLEALKMAYFSRRPGAIIAVDPVLEMRDAANRNLEEAARLNDWFDPSFIDVRDGDALHLPVNDNTADLAAQNCLFNIFKTAEPGETTGDLERALCEMHRALRVSGRLSMSDPITPRPIPQHLQDDETLRAQCISGCLMYDEYIEKIVEAGFGAVEVRSRRPYRMLDTLRYELDENLLLESVEVCAFKVSVPEDGACVFTGRTAIFTGTEDSFDDNKGHVLIRDLPMPVCDKTAGALGAIGHPNITITGSTWHYAGGGCC